MNIQQPSEQLKNLADTAEETLDNNKPPSLSASKNLLKSKVSAKQKVIKKHTIVVPSTSQPSMRSSSRGCFLPKPEHTISSTKVPVQCQIDPSILKSLENELNENLKLSQQLQTMREASVGIVDQTLKKMPGDANG